MHPVRERFIRGKLMPHYLECLSNYTKINVKESDLLSPSISDGILKRLHQLRTQEQYHEITPVDSFELQRILESVFNQGEELIIWIKDADICAVWTCRCSPSSLQVLHPLSQNRTSQGCHWAG